MKQGKVVDRHGTITYYKDDLKHRDDDLPAVIYSDNAEFWYKNGLMHRLAGPAMINRFDGILQYYIDGRLFTKKQHANHPDVKKYRLQKILNKELET